VKLGLPRETFPGERRVALVPAAVAHLKKLGVDLLVEPGAGATAGFPDDAYVAAGAQIAAGRDAVFRDAMVLAQIRIAGANPSADADLSRIRAGQTMIGMCDALARPEGILPWAERKVALFALELMPRITRAQSMDVLSSIATIAGYRAVILAAHASPQLFPLLMTAAGTLKPAKVFVIGAGVAGLQAIATAKRLGASVQGCDVRPAVKEQVESVGGSFFALPGGSGEGQGGYAKELGTDVLQQQQQALAPILAGCDVVICTAAVPGKPAPRLVSSAAVAGMRSGSIIVDLAAESGGNCDRTRPGETIDAEGVIVMGPLNIASDSPRAASEMFSNNVVTFLKSLVKSGELTVNLSDECIAGTLVCGGGEIRHPAVRTALGPALPSSAAGSTPAAPPAAPVSDVGYRLNVE
jgi:NAD(P) transhydrogenase subunit alpha